MTIEELKRVEDEIAELEVEGKNISMMNRIRLKKLEKTRDKATSPIDASAIFVPNSEHNEEIRAIKIDKIVMPEFNDRTGIDNQKIEELAKSISQNGLIQPIVLMENSDGTFTKISGRRRILATKHNGKDIISAIVKKEYIKPKEFNMLVLHENTQREDLSIYDKVRFMLEFIQNELNIDQSEIKKTLYQLDNFQKGKIKKTETIKENFLNLKTLFEDTKLFSSIQHFLKYLPVLDMDISIRELLDTNKITFGMALIFNQYQSKTYIDNLSFDNIVTDILAGQMSINEAKKHFQSKLLKEKVDKSLEIDSIKKNLSSITKLSLGLDKEIQKNLNSELEELLKRYGDL